MDFIKASRRSSSAQVQFIFAELSAGLTFALIARRATDEVRVRNRAHARTAYDSIVRFAERVSMTRKESRDVHTQITSLRTRLEDLGEKLPPLNGQLA